MFETDIASFENLYYLVMFCWYPKSRPRRDGEYCPRLLYRYQDIIKWYFFYGYPPNKVVLGFLVLLERNVSICGNGQVWHFLRIVLENPKSLPKVIIDNNRWHWPASKVSNDHTLCLNQPLFRKTSLHSDTKQIEKSNFPTIVETINT